MARDDKDQVLVVALVNKELDVNHDGDLVAGQGGNDRAQVEDKGRVLVVALVKEGQDEDHDEGLVAGQGGNDQAQVEPLEGGEQREGEVQELVVALLEEVHEAQSPRPATNARMA